MPIREFRCPDGHITEKILHGEADATLNIIPCEAVQHLPDSPSTRYFCDMPARRVDISRTGAPKLVAGHGGFHKPNA